MFLAILLFVLDSVANVLWSKGMAVKAVNNWRSGASQPSRVKGTIFLFYIVYISLTTVVLSIEVHERSP